MEEQVVQACEDMMEDEVKIVGIAASRSATEEACSVWSHWIPDPEPPQSGQQTKFDGKTRHENAEQWPAHTNLEYQDPYMILLTPCRCIHVFDLKARFSLGTPSVPRSQSQYLSPLQYGTVLYFIRFRSTCVLEPFPIYYCNNRLAQSA